MAVTVEIRELTKAYGTNAPVVDGVSIDVGPGELVSLLGPSGCGKTTTLKVVAGLLDPTGGDVRFDGVSVLRRPAERRGVAMVFQKPLLFPHLTVAENVAFGLTVRRVPRATRRARVGAMLDLVRLPGLGDRRATELSGGQEQRVSLARALVTDPGVLLLDEPLSQLDAALRIEMRELIRTVQREVGVTTIFVTHDQEEAVTLSDRIALLLDGRVVQDAPPSDFYTRPATLAVARFFGTDNLVPGRVSGGVWSGPLGRVPAAGAADGPAVLAVRQEALTVSSAGFGVLFGATAQGVEASVVAARNLGAAVRLELRTTGAEPAELRAVVPPTVRAAVGDRVYVTVPDGHGHVLPPASTVG